MKKDLLTIPKVDELPAETLYQITYNGACPYLSLREWISLSLHFKNTDPAVYESLINAGFRRNGFSIYRNLCPNCDSCIPVKVDVKRFAPSKSQRRVLRKNRDVVVRRHPACFDREEYLLYCKYCTQRHGHVPTEEEYTTFLIESPIPTEMMRYHIDGELIGIGWIDVLTDSLSSVYFAFDPDRSHLSPGVFSVMKELELCEKMNKKWLQLGFWVEENRKMSYKTKYKPCLFLSGDGWKEL